MQFYDPKNRGNNILLKKIVKIYLKKNSFIHDFKNSPFFLKTNNDIFLNFCY